MKYDMVWKVTAGAPAHRAIIIKTLCHSIEEGRELLARLRESMTRRKDVS